MLQSWHCPRSRRARPSSPPLFWSRSQLLQVAPCAEWAPHGFPSVPGQGWVGDDRLWHLDAGGLAARVFLIGAEPRGTGGPAQVLAGVTVPNPLVHACMCGGGASACGPQQCCHPRCRGRWWLMPPMQHPGAGCLLFVHAACSSLCTRGDPLPAANPCPCLCHQGPLQQRLQALKAWLHGLASTEHGSRMRLGQNKMASAQRWYGGRCPSGTCSCEAVATEHAHARPCPGMLPPPGPAALHRGVHTGGLSRRWPPPSFAHPHPHPTEITHPTSSSRFPYFHGAPSCRP